MPQAIEHRERKARKFRLECPVWVHLRVLVVSKRSTEHYGTGTTCSKNPRTCTYRTRSTCTTCIQYINKKNSYRAPPPQQVPLVSYPFAALSTYAPPLPLPQQNASGANSAAMRAHHARYAGGGGRGGRGSGSGAAMRAQGKGGGGAVFVR